MPPQVTDSDFELHIHFIVPSNSDVLSLGTSP